MATEARLEALGVETLALAQVLQLGVCNFHLPLLATFPFFRELVGEWARLTQQLLETTARTAVMARGNGAGATGGQGHPSVDLDEVGSHGKSRRRSVSTLCDVLAPTRLSV